MRGWVQVLVTAALIAPSALSAQHGADGVPSCRAQLEGGQLTTTIEYQSGYRVEGPWHVTKSRPTGSNDGETGFMLSAELDEIVEVDGTSGERTSTILPKRIAVTFQAPTHAELVHKAAKVFCFSVVRARAEAGEEDPPTRYAGKSVTAAD